MGVSKNMGGPPKSSILIGFSIINHPFWGPLFLETPMCFSYMFYFLGLFRFFLRLIIITVYIIGQSKNHGKNKTHEITKVMKEPGFGLPKVTESRQVRQLELVRDALSDGRAKLELVQQAMKAVPNCEQILDEMK